MTQPFLVPGARLTVNARARGGRSSSDYWTRGGPIEGPGDAKAQPLDGDVLAGEVRWQGSLGRLRGKPVRLEFRLRRAALFGFDFAA